MMDPKGAAYKLKKKVKGPTRWQTGSVYLNDHDLYDSCSSEEVPKKKGLFLKNSAKVGLLAKTSKKNKNLSLFLESTTFPVAFFFIPICYTYI